MIDIGVNLTDHAFDGDRAAVLARARDAGVDTLIVTGTTLRHSEEALVLARSPAACRLFTTAGVHPHHARDWSDDVARGLATLLREPEVVAVGETGLDFFRDLSPRPAQERAMEAQLALAAQTGRPVFLHARGAADRFLAILRAHRDRFPGGVLHCFTESSEVLHDCLDLGLCIGITGWICDERRGGELAALVGAIPDDRLLIETDAPYLLPRTLSPRPKTRRNEPQWLTAVCAEVARLRGVAAEHVARVTTENAHRLFRLVDG
ncbi:MAG: TatD family hydrolase [Planctomycetota bacterium]